MPASTTKPTAKATATARTRTYSANYGAEGPTEDATINATRLRQIKNLLATLLLSRGVPMLLGGDEFRRTQRGNNNAYCQDNECPGTIGGCSTKIAELFRFARGLIAFRKRNPVLSTDAFYAPDDVEWFGESGEPVRWDGNSRSLGVLVQPHLADTSRIQPAALCLLFNAAQSPAEFRLPSVASRWHLCLDTGKTAPDDIVAAGAEPSIRDGGQYRLMPRSLAVLASP